MVVPTPLIDRSSEHKANYLSNIIYTRDLLECSIHDVSIF